MIETVFYRRFTSDNTRAAYQRDLTAFVLWAQQEGVTLTTLTPATVVAYQDYLLGKYNPSSANRMMSALRTYIAWAYSTGKVDASVVMASKAAGHRKVAEPVVRPLTNDDFKALVEAAHRTSTDLRDVALVLLMARAGLRVSEVVSLDVDDLDLTERTAIVIGKGEKPRRVLLTKAIVAALRAYIGSRTSGPVFVSSQGRLTTRSVQLRISELAASIGREDVTPHTLRHTFATELLDATGDLAMVQDLLGHASPLTTRRYTKYATKRYRAAFDAALEEADPVLSAPTLERRSDWQPNQHIGKQNDSSLTTKTDSLIISRKTDLTTSPSA